MQQTKPIRSGRDYLTIALNMAAGFTAVMFVMVSTLALAAVNLERQMFNPDVYKTALDRDGFYERAPGLIGSDLFTYTASGDPRVGTLSTLRPADLQQIMVALIPPDWLKAETESAIDQLFAMLESDGAPSVMIQMGAFKQRLAGPPGYEAVNRLISTWPNCTDEQILAGSQVIALGGDLSQYPACNPPEAYRDQIMPIIEQAAGRIAASIPDQVNLAPAFGFTAEQDARPSIRSLRSLAGLSLCLPPILLAMIAALAVRKPADLRKWWGIPLLSVGGLGLLTALFLAAQRGELALVLLAFAGPLPASVEQLAASAMKLIGQRTALLMGVESAAVGLVGFLLYGFGYSFSIWRQDKVRKP